MDAIDTPKGSEEIKVSEWLVTLLVTAIPLVGFIMLFVWAFGGSAKPSKANWAKAALLLFAIFIGLYVLLFALFGAAMLAGAGL